MLTEVEVEGDGEAKVFICLVGGEEGDRMEVV